MTRVFYLSIVFFLIGFSCYAQSKLGSLDLETYRHNLSFSDYQASFYTLPEVKVKKAKLGREYYWLSGRQINITSGGYSGKLLHGKFSSFYLNKQLKEQGEFKKGLKEGEWKEWNIDGRLLAITHYSKGIASGKFYKYYENGLVAEAGSYRNGKINGKLKKMVSADSAQVFRYRNGVEYQKTKRPWWKFWKKTSMK